MKFGSLVYKKGNNGTFFYRFNTVDSEPNSDTLVEYILASWHPKSWGTLDNGHSSSIM